MRKTFFETNILRRCLKAMENKRAGENGGKGDEEKLDTRRDFDVASN